MRRLLPILACLLTLAAPAAALDEIWLVRHAEKEDPWPAERELEVLRPLSPEGRERAKALAARLKDAGIAAVYTSRTTRALATAMPLVTATGIRVVADDATIRPEALPAFLAGLRERHVKDRAVLVVGHSNTLPALLAALGATPDCHARLGIVPDKEHGFLTEGYEGIWKVDLKGSGCAAIARQ